MKLNVDGSFRGNSKNCEGSGLIHDKNEKVLGAISTLFGHGMNIEAEMRFLEEGVVLCKEMGFNHIIIECDS